MLIDRPNFFSADALSNGKAISAYGSDGAGSVRSAPAKGTTDLVFASSLATLAASLRELSAAEGGRVEQIQSAYASGQYKVNLGSLAQTLADRISSGRE